MIKKNVLQTDNPSVLQSVNKPFALNKNLNQKSHEIA